MTNWNYINDVMGTSSIRQQLELNTDLSDFMSHMTATDTITQPGHGHLRQDRQHSNTHTVLSDTHMY